MPDSCKVGLLYPWPGLPSVDRGAARRVAPLVSLLAEHFESVDILSPGHGSVVAERNIRHRFIAPGRLEKWCGESAFRIYDSFTHQLWRGRTSARERRQWWHHLQPLIQPGLRRAIRDLAANVDVLLLEYPFWASLLPQGTGAKPVLLTLHDILSNSITEPSLKRIVRNCELGACRRANAISCCTEEDSREIRAGGFQPVLIPHGIDITPRPAPDQPDDLDLEVVAGHRQRGGLVCFFVGSSHEPNREAVAEIVKMADSLRHESRLLFVAAGSCCGRMSPRPNLLFLGPVAEATLDWLYSACDIVLAPLRSGTGSSLKTLEALAKRKVLVSTSVGARGYQLVSGRHALLCDALDEYPGILTGLIGDICLRERLAQSGWDFVQAFDNRKVYLPYVEMIRDLASSRP